MVNGPHATNERRPVMVEGMELMNVAQELSAEQTSMFCSIQGGTHESKVAVFNASNNPDHKVGDYINKVIVVKDVLAELIEVTNDETGEVELTPRVVLIDVDGESYQAVSKGIFNALKKAIAIFGAPTWDEGLPCLIKQVSVGKGSMLTFDVQ